MASLRTAVFLLILRAVASAPPDANSSRGLSDADAAPGHAGCFVMQGNAMLAVKLTYDGNLFDIPGGQTNWHEPARKTAERETWEESGYPVDVQELLTTVRGGSFNIFRLAAVWLFLRCVLLSFLLDCGEVHTEAARTRQRTRSRGVERAVDESWGGRRLHGASRLSGMHRCLVLASFSLEGVLSAWVPEAAPVEIPG